MKKILPKLLALLLSLNAITSLEGNDFLSAGQVAVVEVEGEYQKGKYKNFLDQLHVLYQTAGKVGVIRGVFQNATKTVQKNKELDTLSTFETKRLVEAAALSEDIKLSKKIQSVVFFSQHPEKMDLFKELDQLKYKMPQNVVYTLEDKISAIETEYYIKSLLLDVAHLRSDISVEERYKKKIVLSLEKFHKMETLVNASDNFIWKEKLQKIKDIYHDYLAFRIDLKSLNDLASGKVQPHNDSEEKVKEILRDVL